VPVIRGANLRVGGGFDVSDTVFVTEAKADELRGCLAFPGDIVITQRGTLGQIGLIPAGIEQRRFVLSQSQMKVTVDPDQVSARFLYEQLRTEAATERFVSQAMSSGVPHVNLALLREFEVLVPEVAIGNQFGLVSATFADQAETLRQATKSLVSIRDLLLPRLVTGQIDVSKLDLDAALEGAGV
jgi:type I restriction enzyme S subunit